MSRSIDRGDGELLRRENLQTGQNVTRGRGGSTGAGDSDRRPKEKLAGVAGGRGAGGHEAELASLIDQAAANRPTMSHFIEQLEKRNVSVVPSIQSSGRLNGISY